MKEYRQERFARPPGATEILLVRHGETRAATADDAFPRVMGHGDPELHEEGRRQAELIGARLRNAPVGAIYVTNLRRTLETATPLADQLGLEPIAEPGLREVLMGEWEGAIMRQKIQEQDPLFLRVLAQERWDLIPGAESHAVVNARVMPALMRIHQRHPDQLVVAVSHGAIIGHVLAHAAGSRPFAFMGADNGSISHIVMHGERIILRGYNDTTHL